MPSIRSACRVENCPTVSHTRGWCAKHYRRFNRHGTVEDIVKISVSKMPEYAIWSGMKQRCYNPNERFYNDYGGRGITVCDRWRNSFENFIEDMGRRPEGMTLDRINPDGHYEPSNCRWTTNHVQAWNKRLRKNSKSGYIGVYRCYWKESDWFSKIRLESGENLYLGIYSDKEEAALAFDIAAIFFRGDTAVTNILHL